MTYRLYLGKADVTDELVSLSLPSAVGKSDMYSQVPPEDQRYGGTITYSTPTGINEKITELYRGSPNRHETMITPSGWWFDECSGWFTDTPPPYHHEPKLRDIKTSASVAILVEYMPDTRIYSTWERFGRYCVNDALSVFDSKSIRTVTDIATDRIEYPIYVNHDVTYPPRTFRDEPHWFRHDRKARR